MEITAAIITKNEEKNLPGALDALKWVDEMLVVDTGSTDKTIEVAKKAGARVVISRTKNNYSAWRNKALKEAGGDWILYVDADERVTPELKKEILSLITVHPEKLRHGAGGTLYTTYAIPRKNIILGKRFRHSGQWPDYQKRLFLRKSLKSWEGDIHEQPVLKSANRLIGKLKSPLLHLKHDNFHDMVAKTNIWSEIEARLMYEAGHPKMNVPRFLTAMAREFWLRMIRQKAFLDGPKGVMYAMYQVFSKFVSYAKLWELQGQNKK